MGSRLRRTGLAFSSCEELIAEIERLRDGGYTATGNWNLEQMAEHIAMSMRVVMAGQARPGPWAMRLVGPVVRRVILRSGRIPGRASAPSEVAPTGIMALEDSLASIRVFAACATPVEMRHPILGAMNDGEWRRFQLIHAAHHLSFLVPVTK